MWLNQQTLYTKQCMLIIHNRLEDITMQKWCNDMSTSSMCSRYKMFKKQFAFEKYLLNPNYGKILYIQESKIHSNCYKPLFHTK